ncbi:hypothetical protein [Eubacterium aggregans]|uniref:hypothetical protein n=1 Tax=Eubacterium aggregans TaxID=81409 RepID=UPI003F2E5D2C
MARKYHLTNAERETVINFDREGDMASLYTADSVMMNKLDKLCEVDPDSYKLVREDEGFSKTYEFPKKLISLRKSTKKRELTDEQHKVIAERLKESRNIAPQ